MRVRLRRRASFRLPPRLGGVVLVVATMVVMAAGMDDRAVARSRPAPLLAGVGRADITPPTGYYMMGWVRSDAVATGQHTRLYARVIVLQQGSRKVALVSEDLNGIAGGMLTAAADLDRDLGFSERNVLDSASHTHAAPSGYYNFSNFNTVFMTPSTLTSFNVTGAMDPQLYAFEVRQLALAIRRANADLAPAAIGWGQTQILGLTDNRSLEAHLADFGIHQAYGTGAVSQDPGGYPDTIDPSVDVLRVDHLVHGRHVPIGMWSNFADHGTVDKYQFHYYNADHHGTATRVVEQTLRGLGRVPPGQDIVDVYGNSDEGDMSAGLHRDGPAAADYVGQVEAQAFLAGWRMAGERMTSAPILDERWTRVCFCGQQTAAGPVDTRAVFGLSEFTGSEEGRGPLYDLTHVPFEGDALAAPVGPQGAKIPVTVWGASVPAAFPLVALRIGDRLITSIPGEMTVTMGKRVRASVAAAVAGHGITRIPLAGLANEYIDYFTTPEEYAAQHYEGGATVYGDASSVLIEQSLADLAHRLVTGQDAQPPYPFDPRNGATATAAPFPTGPGTATLTSQPAAVVSRLGHARVSWQGGPQGVDRPLDRAFVVVQRRGARGSWSTVDSDLGIHVLWTADANGAYTAEWEVPPTIATGTYRIEVEGNHYRVVSQPFAVSPSATLTARRLTPAGGVAAVELTYPDPVVNVDLTARPAHSSGGRARFSVAGRRVTVAASPEGRFRFRVAPGQTVELAVGAAEDGAGNSNANALSWTA